jgi:hypothetical protein
MRNRAAQVLGTLLLLEWFVLSLLLAGCSLPAALSAASAIGLIAAEISARFGGDAGAPPAITS